MKNLILLLFLFPTLAYCQTEAGPQTAIIEKYPHSWQTEPIFKDSLRKYQITDKNRNKTKLRKIKKMVVVNF